MAKPRLPWRVFLPRAIAGAAIVFGLITALTQAFSLGLDPQVRTSTGRRLFVVNHLVREPAVGDFVAFRADARVAPFFQEGTLFIKRVVGQAGDGVRLQGHTVLVRESPIGELNPRIEGKILERQHDQYRVRYSENLTRIPDGQLFVANDSPDSFDSRYFGPIPAEQVVGIAYAVF